MTNGDERSVTDCEVVIVGAGLGGIGTAAMLERAGIRDFLLLERAGNVGGTWRVNTYPGVACDVPSYGYQFSFETNPDWSRLFAPGNEIQAYLERCADKYGLRSRTRLNTTVSSAAFDEAARRWVVTTDTGTVTAKILVSAIGPFADAKDPDIPGLADFEGKVMHTTAWDHDFDTAGKRIAVIGTGASAVQAVPELAAAAERLDVYQRTPIWVLPKPDGRTGGLRRVLRRLGGLRLGLHLGANALIESALVIGLVNNRGVPVVRAGLEQVSRAHLRQQVPDPELRDQLTPSYPFGCKRPSLSNSYWRTFTRDNVELVVDPIEKITAEGIVTADGTKRTIDLLVLATGFAMDPDRWPQFEITGRAARDLGRLWRTRRPYAYEGASVPGFPNLLLVFGPHGFNPGSYTNMVEMQGGHLIRLIMEMRRRGASTFEVTEQATDRSMARVQARLNDTVLRQLDCSSSNSYYFDRHGNSPILRPLSTVESAWRSLRFPMSDYHIG